MIRLLNRDPCLIALVEFSLSMSSFINGMTHMIRRREVLREVFKVVFYHVSPRVRDVRVRTRENSPCGRSIAFRIRYLGVSAEKTSESVVWIAYHVCTKSKRALGNEKQ